MPTVVVMISEIDLFATSHPWVIAAASLVLGAVAGHYSALGRDKRKEFNEVADPTRANLRRELKDLRANAQWVKGEDLALLIDMARFYNRPRLRNAVKAYQSARQEHIDVGSYGDRFFTRTDHVQKATEELLLHFGRQ